MEVWGSRRIRSPRVRTGRSWSAAVIARICGGAHGHWAAHMHRSAGVAPNDAECHALVVHLALQPDRVRTSDLDGSIDLIEICRTIHLRADTAKRSLDEVNHSRGSEVIATKSQILAT